MILTIKDPIYTQDVVVAIDEPSEGVIIRAVKRCGYKITNEAEFSEILEMGNSTGRTVLHQESGAVVIRLRRLRKGSADDLGDLAHEAVHAATMLFDRIGFPIEADTDEPMAYYVAFLVRSILEGL
jgi:hypothetical protein